MKTKRILTMMAAMLLVMSAWAQSNNELLKGNKKSRKVMAVYNGINKYYQDDCPSMRPTGYYVYTLRGTKMKEDFGQSLGIDASTFSEHFEDPVRDSQLDFQQYEEDESGNFVARTNDKYIGHLIVYEDGDLQWRMADADVQKLYERWNQETYKNTEKTYELSVAFKFEDIHGSQSHYDDIFVVFTTNVTFKPFTYVPINVRVDWSNYKINKYWYAKNSTDNGSDEVHITVPPTKADNNETNFNYLLSNAFINNEVVSRSIITGNIGFNYNNYNYRLIFHESNNGKKFKGTDGKTYVLRVSDDGRTLLVGIHEIAKLVVPEMFYDKVGDRNEANYTMIEYQQSDIAQALLNYCSHEDFKNNNQEKLNNFLNVVVSIAIQNGDYCKPLSVENQSFNVRFIPITQKESVEGKQIFYLKDLFKSDGNEEITSITIPALTDYDNLSDNRDIQTNLNDRIKPLYQITRLFNLTYHENATLGNYIEYNQSGGFVVQKFNVEIPLEVKYVGGNIVKTTVTLTIGSDDATAKLLLNAENFPDANFRAALASILGISEGDEITAEKIAATTTLKVNSKSIADLTGIEHFTALKYLSCYYNQLTSLDVSGCTALTELYCHSNQLTALDVSGCTALTRLECYYNQLTSLDVSKNTALTGLNCDNNQLTALDVSKNTALEWLFCRNNQLASLDVSKNTALRVLYCFSNQINGEAMDVLVASLPTVNSGSFFVIDTRDENEGNVCTKAQVAVAKGKGWTVCDFNGGNYPYPEYEGSDPVAEGTSEPYAVLSTDNTILTFYYDGLKETRGGMGVGPFSDRPDRGWDSERESITTVVFDASFADCTTLTSTSLWFFGCNNLSTIEGLHNLKTDNVTDMGSMFFECSSLTTLDLSTFNTENVTYMGMMFQYCYNLRELNISNFNTSKVESFFQMFVDCYSLTSLDVSSFNTENAVNMRWMFGGCSKLTSLDVSNFNTQNVVTMGEMFNRCYNLTSLDLSSFDTRNVSTMWSMFRNCYSLTTIYVGDGWTTNSVSEERGANMFTGCIKLVGGAGTSYNADFTDYTYAHIDGGSENPGYFTDKNAEQTFNDGDLFTFESVEGVALTYRVISAANRTCQVGGGDYNVRACDVNTTGTVTVPEVAKGFRVTTVGGYAFYKCSGLTQINLPETIKSIVYCAFQGCSGLTSFVIPSSVTSLSGNHQWNGCTGLTSIHIPANVTSMGNHTFANCPNILEVTVDENNPVYESPAGSHAIINKSKKSIVQGFKNTVIPEGITYIESAAFVGNEYNDIVLPKSFNGFYWDAFEYNAVRSITVAEGNTHFDSRNNCNALMETATDKLVKGCANTVIPSETKIIGEWAFAYAYDSNDYPSLKTVVLPEGLTKIGNWAFGYCKDLEEVTIPSTVTEIMYNAFVGSDNMKKLVSYIQEPFALGEYAFDVWQNKIITLYVPRGTKSLYESTEGWKEFQNIVEMDMNPVEDGDNIDFGTDMNEGDDLNGNVIGDIYYNINTGDGGYDAAEGCIVVKKPTDDGTVNDLEGKDIFGEDFKSQFTGIVFKVPAGKGTIKVNAETTGNMLLKVKIGANDPVEMELNGKLKVTFPYNVSETTYVYIYAGAANEAKGFGTTNDAEDAALKIYGIEFIRDNTPTEINAVDSGELTVDSWYTIDGKKLAGEPKEKGVYINKGRKVVK